MKTMMQKHKAVTTSLLLGTIILMFLGCKRPSLSQYETLFANPSDSPAPVPNGAIRATFFGVSTLLLTDGQTNILIDGFFSRFAGIEEFSDTRSASPSPEEVTKALTRAGITHLDAVLVVHSHYDHAMDAPEVARQTGAIVLGSESTGMICKGWGLPDEQFQLVELNTPVTFGNFTVTFIESRHGPFTKTGSAFVQAKRTPKAITEPLVPPVFLMDYPLGGAYTIHLAHPKGKVVVHASAGFLRGALADYQAEVVFLGIGRLGNQFKGYQRAYYDETVGALGAKHIIPVHWDDHKITLDEPLRPMSRSLDRFEDAMDFLIKRVGETSGATLQMMRAFEEVVLFE
jgi:L-ascorbate metabolism protein UlaG (beta-lactamase superfamily)